MPAAIDAATHPNNTNRGTIEPVGGGGTEGGSIEGRQPYWSATANGSGVLNLRRYYTGMLDVT
jgi:hypothetical protein